MVKPITRLCLDCNSRLANRSKSTIRCMECYKKYRASKQTGRKLPQCNKCAKQLTIKANKTGLCIKCQDRSLYKKRDKNINPAWNKGISIFKDQEDKRKNQNERRKIIRAMKPKEMHIADRIRTLIRVQLKRASLKKNTRTSEIVGCSMAEFKLHIENQFQSWMNWDNYGNGNGKWNIDHILPVTSFNLTDEEELKKAFNYKNCRPLCSIENIKKGNKIGYNH